METAFPGSSQAAQKFALELVAVAAGDAVEGERGEDRRLPGAARTGGRPASRCASAPRGGRSPYTGDTEWTPALIPAAQGADLFIAEAYFRDKAVATHLSLAAIEAHLAELAPRRLVLTHMSDDMLNATRTGRASERRRTARCWWSEGRSAPRVILRRAAAAGAGLKGSGMGPPVRRCAAGG